MASTFIASTHVLDINPKRSDFIGNIVHQLSLFDRKRRVGNKYGSFYQSLSWFKDNVRLRYCLVLHSDDVDLVDDILN